MAEIAGWSALVRDPRVVAGKGVALFTLGMYRGQILNYDLVLEKSKSDIVIGVAAVVGTLVFSICIMLWLFRRYSGGETGARLFKNLYLMQPAQTGLYQ